MCLTVTLYYYYNYYYGHHHGSRHPDWFPGCWQVGHHVRDKVCDVSPGWSDTKERVAAAPKEEESASCASQDGGVVMQS